MDQKKTPPLFSDKSLRTFTKIVAIYAGFYVIVVVGQSLSEPVNENPMAPANAYVPMYVLAAGHLLLGLINLGIDITKKYNWVVPSLSALLMLFSRIYHLEISQYLWSL